METQKPKRTGDDPTAPHQSMSGAGADRPTATGATDADRAMVAGNGVADGEATAASRSSVMIGRYRVLRLLGEGAMGSVFLAEQENPHRIVALKVIKPGFVNSELLRRFDQEADALGRLQRSEEHTSDLQS